MKKRFAEPKPITTGMRQGLARMYADPFMREYLTNAIAIANHNVIILMKNNKSDEARDYVSRITSLEQLLKKGEEYYVQFEKIQRGVVNKSVEELQVNEIKL